MKLHFDSLIIWLKNGKVRTLAFLPNKVNIITGGSNTGKTAILDIIDYCFFASRHKISESMINENAEWYGIRITINAKNYVIARKAPSGNIASHDYYFSSVGESPNEFPLPNITEGALKTALEADFSIDRDTKFPYGGKHLKANSKISLRYFLILNTISQDIITHSEEFFDKQKDDKYREALPRIFDLALGIDTVENIIKREKRDELERELRKLEREGDKISRKQDAFYSQLLNTIRTAKEYALVSEDSDADSSISQLREMISTANIELKSGITDKYSQKESEINELNRKIRNLRRFSAEYARYKTNLKYANDSLKPLEYIAEHLSQIIKTSIYDDIIISLKSDHEKIKQAIVNKTPLESNISDIIKGYEEKINELQEQQKILPKEVKSFEDEKQKFIFIGETKAKLDLYEREGALPGDNKDVIDDLKKKIESLIVDPVEDRRSLFTKVLDETIQEYITSTALALENYKDYRSSFNYKEKKLQLRKPKTDFIENVGSSSNHMFLHLFLFLGLHEIIRVRKTPFVPPFLVIDQFSRPYWGEGEQKKEILEQTDISRVKSALNLLNHFIQSANEEGDEFQMIVFEHINEELWERLPHIHLVEEFRNGNALIPKSMLDE